VHVRASPSLRSTLARDAALPVPSFIFQPDPRIRVDTFVQLTLSISIIKRANAFFPDGASHQSGAAIVMRLLETGQHATILFGDTSIKGIK